MLELRSYQQAALNATYDHIRRRDDNPCVVLPTGCHAKGHPILMHDGTIKGIETIRVGDQLMGPDSRPRTVIKLCRGHGDMYRITPVKGESFVVNGDHILSLQCTNEGKKAKHPKARSGGEIENICVRDYLGKAKYWKHLRKLYRAPVDFPHREHFPIPPYILGALLGDGYINGTVGITKADIEMIQEFAVYTVSLGCSIARKVGDDYTWKITVRRGEKNPVLDKLRELDLEGLTSEFKHVPHSYLAASREQRRELLAGLMDSDGYLGNGGYDFISKSPRLAADTAFLARSLGLAAYVAECEKSCQNGFTGTYHRVSISGDCSIIPCRIKRKQSPVRQQIKNVLRTGFTVEPVGNGDYFGFILDSDHLYLDGSFTVHHNSGKTPLLASICSDTVLQWHGRVLVLSHVKELLEQAANHLASFLPINMVGLHSAGLGRRDTDHPVLVAGIQTVANKAFDLGKFDLIIVDEAHLIPESGEGRYLTFLRDAKIVNPYVRVIGLTATPFRLGSGVVCKPENILNHICYEANVKELILQGWLCPLRTKRGLECANLEGVKISSTGDFASDEMQAAFEAIIRPACIEIAQLCADRRSILIFAAGIEHAAMVAQALGGDIVIGNTPKEERADIISRFRAGKIRYLVNVGVLTTGFDAPNVDAVVLLRATMSAGLYCQMVGRGLRKHPDKADCLILDYGDNALRHGPIDQIEVQERSKKEKIEDAPGKECPNCHEVIAVQYRICPNCEYEFPFDYSARHNDKAGDAPILSGEDTVEEKDVVYITYSQHVKRKAEGDSVTFRVDYFFDEMGTAFRSEYLCFNHPLDSWVRKRAEEWWRLRSAAPVPATVMDAVTLAQSGALAKTTAITMRHTRGNQYPDIVGYQFGDIPEWSGTPDDDDFFAIDPIAKIMATEDIPF